MPTATGNPVLFLVITAFIFVGIYLGLKAKTTRRNESPESSDSSESFGADSNESLVGTAQWTDCCEELEQESHQLALLLERLEAQASGSDYTAVDDTTVVDLAGVAYCAEDVVRLNDQRMADLQAALNRESQCPDWEQESPEMVSIIEDLQDIYEPASDRSVEPDDLKQIRGIGKVLEGVLNEKGIETFEQLAALSLDDIEALSQELKHFGDRVRRDRWIEQAQALASSKAG